MIKSEIKREINNKAIRLIRTGVFSEIINSVNLSEMIKNAQHNTQEDYQGSILYELLQNAKDVCKNRKIKIVLSQQKLFFCNAGAPINKKNFDCLCGYALSDKGGNSEQTGKYGIGKANYYEIAKKNHRYYSRSDERSPCINGYCFELSSDSAEKYRTVLLNLSKNAKCPFDSTLPIADSGDVNKVLKKDPNGKKRSEKLDNILINLPIPIEADTEIETVMTGYSTTVVLPVDDDKTEVVKENLQDFLNEIPQIMLFIPTIEQIEVMIDNTVHTFTQERILKSDNTLGDFHVNITHKTADDDSVKSYYLWHIEANEENKNEIYAIAPPKIKERNPLVIEIALEENNSTLAGAYFCDLPTEKRTDMAIHINANFHLQSDRKNVQWTHRYNDTLLDFIAEQQKIIIERIINANDNIPNEQTGKLVLGFLISGGHGDEVFNKLKGKIDIANLSFISSRKNGQPCWASPLEVYEKIFHYWGDYISEEMFYRHCNYPVIHNNIDTEVTREFIGKFNNNWKINVISMHKQLEVLVSIIQNSSHDQHSNIWSNIIKTWSDFINWEDPLTPQWTRPKKYYGLKFKAVFLGKARKLHEPQMVYRSTTHNSLMAPKNFRNVQYPYFQLNDGLEDIFKENPNLSKEDFFASAEQINKEWCGILIENMQKAKDGDEKKFYFEYIIKNFFTLLNKNDELLKKMLFPCTHDKWLTLGDIYAGNGWGSEADKKALNFLEFCGESLKEIEYLRGKNANIWQDNDLKNHVDKLSSKELKQPPVIKEYSLNFEYWRTFEWRCEIPSLIKELYEAEIKKHYPQESKRYAYSTRKDDFFRWLFPLSLSEITEPIQQLLLHVIEKNITDVWSEIERKVTLSGCYNKSFMIETPMFVFLKNQPWVPAGSKFVKPDQIQIISDNLIKKYSFLSKYEGFDTSDLSKEIISMLKNLGAQEISSEENVAIDEIIRLATSEHSKQTKDGLKKFIKAFWAQALDKEKLELPKLLLCRDADKKLIAVNPMNEIVYIADVSGKESDDYVKSFHPCLDIPNEEQDELIKKLRGTDLISSYKFKQWSDMDGQYFADGKPLEELASESLLRLKSGMFAIMLLLLHRGDKEAFSLKMRELRIARCHEITLKISESNISKPACYKNNSFVVSDTSFEMNFSREWVNFDQKSYLKGNAGELEMTLQSIGENWNRETIINTLSSRGKITVSYEIFDEARDALFGVEHCMLLLKQFIQLEDNLWDKIAEAKNKKERDELFNSIPDQAKKKDIIDFFNSDLSIPERGKLLYRRNPLTDLSAWNQALADIEDGSYVNPDFNNEFNERHKNSILRFSTLLKQLADYKYNDNFFINAITDWKKFDGANANTEYWEITDEIFDEIIKKFIKLKYPIATSTSHNDENLSPYEIYRKNKSCYEKQENPCEIDIENNKYFLAPYPESHFQQSVVQERQNTAPNVASSIVNSTCSHPPAQPREQISRPTGATNPQQSNAVAHRNVIQGQQRSSGSTVPEDIVMDWTKPPLFFQFDTPVATPQQMQKYRNYSGSASSDANNEEQKLTNEQKREIGQNGENYLYQWLCSQYKNENVKWVSKNNQVSYIGDDFLGYDFEINEGKNILYLECKATSGNGAAKIELGRTEFEKAQECLHNGETYSVYRLHCDESNIVIRDLGNPCDPSNCKIKHIGISFSALPTEKQSMEIGANVDSPRHKHVMA